MASIPYETEEVERLKEEYIGLILDTVNKKYRFALGNHIRDMDYEHAFTKFRRIWDTLDWRDKDILAKFISDPHVKDRSVELSNYIYKAAWKEFEKKPAGGGGGGGVSRIVEELKVTPGYNAKALSYKGGRRKTRRHKKRAHKSRKQK